jgi:hypothetical protein
VRTLRVIERRGVSTDAELYCSCMEQLLPRFELVKCIFAKQVTSGHDSLDAEIVFLQFRKMLEHIAFASLVANKDVYSNIQRFAHRLQPIGAPQRCSSTWERSTRSFTHSRSKKRQEGLRAVRDIFTLNRCWMDSSRTMISCGCTPLRPASSLTKTNWTSCAVRMLEL